MPYFELGSDSNYALELGATGPVHCCGVECFTDARSEKWGLIPRAVSSSWENLNTVIMELRARETEKLCGQASLALAIKSALRQRENFTVSG